MESKGRRHNAVIMLEILLAGLPIKFKDDDREYYYQEGMFGIRATKTNTSKPGYSEEVLLGVDLSLQDFIRLCEKMSFEEVYIKGCEMVLTLYNRKERSKVG